MFIHDWFVLDHIYLDLFLDVNRKLDCVEGVYVDPQTVSQNKQRRAQGKRITLHVCLLSRDNPAQNMFSVILTGIFPIGESSQYSLEKQETVCFILTSGFTSEHVHTHRVRAGQGERESLFLFDPSHIHLPFFPPSLPLTCN